GQSLMTNAYGSVSGSFRLSSETPSGSGTVFLDVPGSPGEAFSFTIASYRKPEFTVTARAKRRAYISGETAEVEVSAEYYYGAPVAGATVKYRAMWQSLWEWEPNHAPYDGYEAEWGQRSAGVSPADLSGTATLDQQGRTIVRLPAGDVGGPQALQGNQLSVWVEVTDGARRWAEATAETRVYAGSVRLFLRPAGYVLIPGRSVSFVVQATDLVGKPVHSLPVTLEVERESRDGSKVASHRVGAVAGATDGRGLASLAFTPSKSGELLVTASARDPQGRRVAAATYVWSVSDAGGDIAGETATLELHTDKQRYSIGDTARVLINTDLVGADALVTVESGDVVHRAMVVPLRQRSTVLLLPVGRECAPNAELSVCAVGRKTFHSNSAPIRVSVPDRTLKVTLSPASGSVRPGSQTRFRLSVTNQRGDPVRAEASLAVVDEAIYQLEEDTPGAIADAFYPETYSRVQTWHSCPDRLYSGDKGKPRIEARRKFEDAPFWAPHLVTDDAGSAEVGVRLPDNLTTWRATAIVHSLKSQFGYSTARVVATLPFHVRLQIPRFVTQSDRVQAVASVTNASGVQRAVQVRLTGRGVTVAGAPTRTVTVEPSGVVEVPWLVEARVPGAAQLKVEAWSSAPTMLTDGVEQTIEVRPMAREVTHVFAGSIQPQGRSVHQFDAPAGVAPGALSVRITPSPIAAIPAALSYVELFPYACTEQTISGFLPSLMVRRLLRALPDPTAHSLQAALGRAGTVPIEDSVRDGLTRLRVLQRSDGSWGWFENDAGDPWLTAYALLALAEARRDGLTMHRHMADEGCQAAMRLLNNSEPDDRAFLALGLAHFGKNALHRLNLPRLSAGGLVCAAQAMRVLRVNGKRLSEVERRLLATTRTVSGMAVWPGRGPRFASQWTGHIATAMVVRYLLETQPSSALPDEAVRYLMVSRTDDHWSSTRDTAFVLMALCDYARARPQGGAAPKDVIVRLNGSVAATLEADSIPDREPEARVRVAGLPIRPGRNTVSVECASSARPYYSVAVRTQSAGTMDRPDSTLRGAVLTRTYDALRHSTLPLRGTVRHYEPIRGSVAGGTVVRCRLVVKVEDNLAFVMITDPIPACF
ncbi:MAG: hypothetical protein FJX72_12985, partial [Armatimonadetes bacterium]|nr:hypothetical protein [Armatimonadota bacterium]